MYLELILKTRIKIFLIKVEKQFLHFFLFFFYIDKQHIFTKEKSSWISSFTSMDTLLITVLSKPNY